MIFGSTLTIMSEWQWRMMVEHRSVLMQVKHAKPFCIGLNCALGAQEMRPHLEDLANIANCYVHAYPNAGLPNEFGEYDQTPHEMCDFIDDFVESGFVNIVGGCCGTTPDHIRHMADHVSKHGKPRQLTAKPGYSCLLYTSPSPRDRTRSRMPSSA